MNPSRSLPASCSSHHYWTRLRARMTGRQWCHACNVRAWTSASAASLTDAGVLVIDDDWEGFPVIPHGGDITVLPDPDIEDGEVLPVTPQMITDATSINEAIRAKRLYSRVAVVPKVPLDGIERIRKWLSRQ